MSLLLNLAWRNVWRHRRRTVIVIAAIGLGLSLMMVYDGLITGFDQAIYGNAIKVFGGNIQIHAQGYSAELNQNPLLPLPNDTQVLAAARALPQVVGASRRINTGGLVSNHTGAFPVKIIGIEPEAEAPTNIIAQHVTAGRYLAGSDQDVVLIGKGLADEMNVRVGDRITVAGQAAHNQMRSRTLTVIGIYDLGMPDIEKQSVYISLGEAQALYGLTGQATEVTVTLQRIGGEAAVMAALKPALGTDEITSWQTSFPELQSALAAKGQVMDIFSTIIMVIAGIGILNLLLMAVYERTREIGILGAFGMLPRQISVLFLLEGGLMGLVGVAAGIVLGLIFNILLGRVGLDFTAFSSLTSYMALINSRVYPGLGLQNLASRAITVLVIALLAALYPAREASMREPAEALHSV